jgi:hypothetical protein
MKLVVALATVLTVAGLVFGLHLSTSVSATPPAAGPDGRKQPDVLQLAPESKLGAVSFSHTNHTTKNYNIAGSGPVACIECHHTEQPAAEVAKHPPLKTGWPADRTTTLTAESLEKDPKVPDVVACRSCHARAGATPKAWPAIPEIKYEGGTAMVALNNQQAFHRNCAGCHDEAAKQRNAKAPQTKQCTACHKK